MKLQRAGEFLELLQLLLAAGPSPGADVHCRGLFFVTLPPNYDVGARLLQDLGGATMSFGQFEIVRIELFREGNVFPNVSGNDLNDWLGGSDESVRLLDSRFLRIAPVERGDLCVIATVASLQRRAR